MSRCQSCRSGLRSIVGRKLGRCPRCMRWSAFGTLTGWTASATVYARWPDSILVWLSLLLTVSFTALLIAHLVAFMVRMRAMWDTVRDEASALSSARFRAERRAFLWKAAAAVVVSVFGFGYFGRPRPVQAIGACEQPEPRDTAFPIGSIQLCAPSATVARRRANRDPDARAEAARVAGDFCGLGISCRGSRQCVAGDINITWDCVASPTSSTSIQTGSESGNICADLQLFTCTGTVTSVECRCRLVPPPAGPRCGPLSANICDTVRANITAARCQAQCNPGTPRCQQVAPNDFCKGQLRGPVFTSVRGGTTFFCQWCACVCGEFIPGP